MVLRTIQQAHKCVFSSEAMLEVIMPVVLCQNGCCAVLHLVRYTKLVVGLKTWFHVQLLYAPRCNNRRLFNVLDSLQLVQRVACNNCIRNHVISDYCCYVLAQNVRSMKLQFLTIAVAISKHEAMTMLMYWSQPIGGER